MMLFRVLIVLALVVCVLPQVWDFVGPKKTKAEQEEAEFDWIGYLSQNADLQQVLPDRRSAWVHFVEFGRREKRSFSSLRPQTESLEKAQVKFHRFITDIMQRNISVLDRTLLMYYLPSTSDVAVDTMANNVKMFAFAVRSDRPESSSNLYWINAPFANVNPYLQYFPTDAANVIVSDWHVRNPLYPILLTLHTCTLLYKQRATQQFGSLLFLDSETRGPFSYRERGEWVQVYRNLLYRPDDIYNLAKLGGNFADSTGVSMKTNKHNVVLAGSTISCEVAPHIHNSSYIVRSDVISPMLRALLPEDVSFKHARGILKYSLQYLSTLIKKNYNIASLMTMHMGMGPVWNGDCGFLSSLNTYPIASSTHIPHRETNNPITWCSLNLTSLLFVHWGKGMSGLLTGLGNKVVAGPGVCPQMKTRMYAMLDSLSGFHKYSVGRNHSRIIHQGHSLSINHIRGVGGSRIHTKATKRNDSSIGSAASTAIYLRETSNTGIFRDLYLEYEGEVYKRGLEGRGEGVVGRHRMVDKGDNVCLLVRTNTSVHIGPYNVSSEFADYFNTYENLIQSLLRQKDSHWNAYFYLIPNVPSSSTPSRALSVYADKLKTYLQGFQDERIQLLAVSSVIQGSYSDYQRYEEGVFSATDSALSYVLSYTHCSYISFTHATNIYGTNAIHNVRSGAMAHSHPMGTSYGAQPTSKARPGRKSFKRGRQGYNISSTSKYSYGHSSIHESLQHELNGVYSESFQSDSVKVYMLPMDSAGILYGSVAERGEDKRRQGICHGLIVSLQLNVLGMASLSPVFINPLTTTYSSFLPTMFWVKDELIAAGATNFSIFLNSSIPVDRESVDEDDEKSICGIACVESRYMHHLLHTMQWRVGKLPTTGLQSLVFVAPSPVWCIASGNVWVSYPTPEILHPYCQPPVSIQLLHSQDLFPKQLPSSFSLPFTEANAPQPVYDWEDMNVPYCLMPSKKTWLEKGGMWD